jgi:hypothetical protein
MGTFHNVSAKYLPLYLAEFQFCPTIANTLIFLGKRYEAAEMQQLAGISEQARARQRVDSIRVAVFIVMQ